MPKPKSALITVFWNNGTEQQWQADRYKERDLSIEMEIGGCQVHIPWQFYKDGEVKHIDVEA